MFNIKQFPSYLVYELWGSGKYDFGRLGCDFIVSGLSSTGECHIYRVFGEHGEILELSDVQNYYSEDYMHINGVGGKWIFYVLDFKTKKGKYVKFCADGKFRYYSKLVRNKFD